MPTYRFTDATARPSHEEAGDYKVKVIKFEFGVAQQSGNDMLKLELETPNGVIVYDNLVFSEKAAWKIDTALKCFLPSKGVPLPDRDEDFEMDDDWVTENLLGATGMVTLNVEPAQKNGQVIAGKFRNNVAVYLEPGAAKKPAAAAAAAAAKPTAAAAKPAAKAGSKVF